MCLEPAAKLDISIKASATTVQGRKALLITPIQKIFPGSDRFYLQQLPFYVIVVHLSESVLEVLTTDAVR